MATKSSRRVRHVAGQQIRRGSSITYSSTKCNISTNTVSEVSTARKALRTVASSARQASLCARETLSSTARHNQLSTLTESSTALPPYPAGRPRTSASIQPPATDVRSRLRQWQTAHSEQSTPLPVEPIDSGTDGNDLTRPESLNRGDIGYEEDEDFLDAPNFVGVFDRMREQDGSFDPDNLLFRRGELVVLGKSLDAPLLAVFIRYIGKKWQYYTMHGTYFDNERRSASFVVPGFVDPAELEPILPYLPDEVNPDTMELVDRNVDQIPCDVAPGVLTKMAQFREEAEAYYRRYLSVLDNAHAVVAHPTETQLIPLQDIITTLTGVSAEKTPPALSFAVSSALFRTGFGFTGHNRRFAESHIMIVESQTNTATVARVQRWTRAYQEEMALIAGGFAIPLPISSQAAILKSFAKKCRQLVAESRQLRRSTPEGHVLSCAFEEHSEPPRSAFIHSLEFSDTDRDIIRVLGLHVGVDHFNYNAELSTISTAIMRAVGTYTDTRLDETACQLLLVEIGVMAPYAVKIAVDRDIVLATPELDKELQMVEAMIAKGQTPAVAAKLNDSMSHLRKDWGDLLVLCIDSDMTVDIDDGISIEDIPDSPGECWLRIHVAHPSAFTTPNSLLGRLAKSRTGTFYLPDSTETMFPRWCTSLFSLASGKPVLTYSARLNEHGETLEVEIQPGIIHNVAFVSYDKVSEILNLNPARKQPQVTIKVGGDVSELRQKARSADLYTLEFTDVHKATLKKLYQACGTLLSRHPPSPFQLARYSTTQSRVWNMPRSAKLFTNSGPSHAVFETEDPKIETTVVADPIDEALDLADAGTPDKIVVQPMTLACVIAARWAADRDLCVPFLGTRTMTDSLDANIEAVRAKLKQLGTGEAGWSRQLNCTVQHFFGSTVFSSRPIEHRILQQSVYAKVTSPLRRCWDLLFAWQVDAALREEARTGTSLAGSKDDGRRAWLPIQRAEMDEIIHFNHQRDLARNRYAVTSIKHWFLIALARAFYHKEAELPPRLTAHFERIGNRGLRKAQVLELGLLADFLDVAGEDGNVPVVGDIWEVEIVAVLPYTRRISVKPVKRLRQGRYLL